MKMTKSHIHNNKVRKQNLSKMHEILNVIKEKITKFGGCFIKNYGPAYYNSDEFTRDPIGHLLKISDLRGHFGTIDSEAQKPLIRKISNKFGLNLSNTIEYEKFTKFLQLIQDAHDELFDKFNNKELNGNLRQLFCGKCNKIAHEMRIV